MDPQPPFPVIEPLGASHTPPVIERSKNGLKIALVGVLLFVVAGASYGGYYYYTERRWNDSDKVIKTTIANFSKASSLAYAGEGDFSFTAEGIEDLEFSPSGNVYMKVEGAYNGQDTKNKKMNMSGDGKVVVNVGGFELSFGGNVAYIILGEDFYFKVNVPNLFAMLGVTTANNQWIRLDKEFKEEIGLPPQTFEKDAADAFDPQKLQALRESLSTRPLISRIEKLPSEKVDGKSLRGYRVWLNMDEVKKIIFELDDMSSKKATSEEKKFFNTFFDKISSPEIDVWIDDDFYPRMIKTGGQYSLNAKDLYGNKFTTGEDMKGSFKYTAKISTTFKDFNKSIDIKPPESSKTMKEVMEEAEKKSPQTGLFGARKKALDAKIKANMSMVRVTAELYYGAHNGYGTKAFNGPCPTGSLQAYGAFGDPDFQKAIDEIQKDNGGIRPLCALVPDKQGGAWAMSSPLGTNPANYWCVDSMGSSIETTKSITTARCLK